MTARSALEAAGFTGESLDIALGVSFAESGGYSDAVGDVTLVDAKWGPSIGLFQVRSLREPMRYGIPDQVRYARALLNPWFNAEAAYVISRQGSDFNAWTMFRNGGYQQHLGIDYELKTGHARASEWSK